MPSPKNHISFLRPRHGGLLQCRRVDQRDSPPVLLDLQVVPLNIPDDLLPFSRSLGQAEAGIEIVSFLGKGRLPVDESPVSRGHRRDPLGSGPYLLGCGLPGGLLDRVPLGVMEDLPRGGRSPHGVHPDGLQDVFYERWGGQLGSSQVIIPASEVRYRTP
jgi:hypothetical protein